MRFMVLLNIDEDEYLEALFLNLRIESIFADTFAFESR